MPIDPMTGQQLPYDDEGLDMMAMESMLGPEDPMGSGMEMVQIEVPAYAVQAVMELVSMMDAEMGGMPMDDGMGMDPMMNPGMGMDPGMGADPMMGGMPPMM